MSASPLFLLALVVPGDPCLLEYPKKYIHPDEKLHTGEHKHREIRFSVPLVPAGRSVLVHRCLLENPVEHTPNAL